MVLNKIVDFLKKIFVPGYLGNYARAFWVFLFLVITIAQTYCTLLMNELKLQDIKDTLNNIQIL